MKTQEEIEQLAKSKFITNKNISLSESNKTMCRRSAFIKGYTQCQEDSKDKKYTLRDIEKAFLEGCASERKFSRRIDDLDKYINSLNKQD